MATARIEKQQGNTRGTFTPQVSEITSKAALILFMTSFLIPANVQIGTLTIGFPKLFLLIMFIPSVLIFLKTPSLRFGLVDGLVLGFVLCSNISILANHGLSRIEYIGLQLVEMLGAYIVARVFVRTLADYKYFWKAFGICMICILPLAVIELLTDRVILIDLVKPLFPVFEDVNYHYRFDRRFGFDRVQGNFENPILFGVFWGLGFATLIALSKKWWTKTLFGGGAALMVGLSISSGAYLALMFQLALMFWGWVTKRSWKFLLILSVICYIVIEIASTRPALVAIGTRLAFRKESAYWRVHIWTHGSQNVWDNPIFGIGLNDWARPVWLSSTVDNHWLLVAMQGGLPVIIFLLSSFSAMLWQLTMRKDFPENANVYRQAYVITFVAMFVALATVAVWSATQSFLLFFLGLGVCLANLPAQTTVQENMPDAEPQTRVQRSPRQQKEQDVEAPHDAPQRKHRATQSPRQKPRTAEP